MFFPLQVDDKDIHLEADQRSDQRSAIRSKVRSQIR